MSGIVTLGIDLAKNVFALHGVDGAGKPVLVRPNVARSALVAVVSGLGLWVWVSGAFERHVASLRTPARRQASWPE